MSSGSHPRPDRVERLQPAEEQRVLPGRHRPGQRLVEVVVGVDEPRRHHAAAARRSPPPPRRRPRPPTERITPSSTRMSASASSRRASSMVTIRAALRRIRRGIGGFRLATRSPPYPQSPARASSDLLEAPAGWRTRSHRLRRDRRLVHSPAASRRGEAMSAAIGLVGLGTMGAALALNIAEKGFPDRGLQPHRQRHRTPSPPSAGPLADAITPCDSLEALVAALDAPRAPIILMVPGRRAGRRDDRRARAAPRHRRHDHRRRQRQLPRHPAPRRRGRRPPACPYLGIGVSGGEEGARHGPSIMGGGPRAAWDRVEPILEAIAAKFDGEPLRHLAGHRRRRPLRQDHPQRHRICRHADDRRGLRHHARRPRPWSPRRSPRSSSAGTRARSIPTSSRSPASVCARHRPRDRQADGRRHPRQRRPEGHRPLVGDRGAAARRSRRPPSRRRSRRATSPPRIDEREAGAALFGGAGRIRRRRRR